MMSEDRTDREQGRLTYADMSVSYTDVPVGIELGNGEIVLNVPKKDRPSWDEYFLDIARSVSRRSTCDRLHVGVVLVRDKRILTTGYNGSPSGMPHCDDVGHWMLGNHCIRTLHGEQNAIIQAALHGISLKGATAYITDHPCNICAKMLIQAGIVRVVIADDTYKDENAVKMFAMAGVPVGRVK